MCTSVILNVYEEDVGVFFVDVVVDVVASKCDARSRGEQTLTAASCVSPQPPSQPVGEPHRGAAHDADTVLPGPQPQRCHPPQQQRLP